MDSIISNMLKNLSHDELTEIKGIISSILQRRNLRRTKSNSGLAPKLPEKIAPKLPEKIAPKLPEKIAPKLPEKIAPKLPEKVLVKFRSTRDEKNHSKR